MPVYLKFSVTFAEEKGTVDVEKGIKRRVFYCDDWDVRKKCFLGFYVNNL